MGIKKKHVPGCSCCGECSYEASDGNEYSDDFSGLDAGWLTDAGSSVSVSGGQLIFDGNTFDHHYCYRSISVTEADCLIIMEVQWYSVGTTNTQLMFISGTLGGNPNGYGFGYNGGANRYTVQPGGTSVGPTPTNGYKLSMKIQSLGGGQCRICYFIEEELVYETVQTLDPSIFLYYGFITEIVFNQTFDNFSIHNGNP